MYTNNKVLKWGAGAVILVATVAIVGCDWTTGGSGFNTSRGRGNVDFSGFYRGNHDNGRAVADTSGGIINTLMISQQGDALEVRDNNGSVYRGRIGSVSLVNVGGTAIGAGTQVAHAQVSWSGHDNVAALTVEFVGSIRAVTVEDIQASTVTRDQDVETERTFITDDGTERVTETVTVDDSGGTITTITTITTSNLITGAVTTDVTTEQSLTEATFSLEEQNTQYRLQGTWMEVGGRNAPVDAVAAGSAGTIISTGGGSAD